jgi:hypothetical protein
LTGLLLLRGRQRRRLGCANALSLHGREHLGLLSRPKCRSAVLPPPPLFLAAGKLLDVHIHEFTVMTAHVVPVLVVVATVVPARCSGRGRPPPTRPPARCSKARILSAHGRARRQRHAGTGP